MTESSGNLRRRLDRALQKLTRALEGGGSRRYCLRLWSSFITERDGHRCVWCELKERLNAHHIFRRTLLPQAQFEEERCESRKRCHPKS